MLLTKNKILEDKQFIEKLATEIGKFDNSLMIKSLSNASVDYQLSNSDSGHRYNTFLSILLTDIRKHLTDNTENTIDSIGLILQSLLQNQMYKGVLENVTKKILEDFKQDLPEIITAIVSALLLTEEGKICIRKIAAACEDTLIDYKKESKEPWVNITGETYDPSTGQMKMSLDWNESFIKLLRKQGLMGENEDELVEQWLKGISSQ